MAKHDIRRVELRKVVELTHRTANVAIRALRSAYCLAGTAIVFCRRSVPKGCHVRSGVAAKFIGKKRLVQEL
jgi:hypothetical protein